MNNFFIITCIIASSSLTAMHLSKEVLKESPKINASALQGILPATVAKRKFSCIYPSCTNAAEYVPRLQNNNTFIALENFVEHVKSHAEPALPNTERDARIIICRNIGCSFGSSIFRLIIKHQAECPFKPVDTQRIDGPQAIKCPICAKIFKSSCGLMTHMRHNSKCVSKYSCDYALQGCNFESLYSSNYYSHIKICQFKPKAT